MTTKLPHVHLALVLQLTGSIAWGGNVSGELSAVVYLALPSINCAECVMVTV